MSRNPAFVTFMLVPAAVSLNMAFSPSVALGQKFVPNHLGLASGITMGLASSVGGVVSPMLGKVADNGGQTGVITVLWILVTLAALAAAASFFVPDAPGFKKKAKAETPAD